MGDRLTVTAQEPIEWYDGIVSGFVRLQDASFLCAMLAFEPNAARRSYVLVPIATDRFPAIPSNGLEGFFRDAFDRAIATSTRVYLTRDEPVVGSSIAVEPVESPGSLGLLRELCFPRINDAVLPGAWEKWL